MGPHSVSLQFLGTFGLWFGWYGFNPGSTLRITTAALGDVASLVAVNTTLGAAAGALSGMFTSTVLDERKTGIYQWDTTAAMNGCLTGLVSVTAGCATVEPWAGFVIGIVAGWVYLAASALMLRLKIDDAVDAIPVHMFGGAWGGEVRFCPTMFISRRCKCLNSPCLSHCHRPFHQRRSP